MKISFPGFKKQKKIFLVLDIGTEAIKALIFKKNNNKIIILGSSLQYFDRFGVFDSRVFETDVIKKAISKTIEEVKGQTKAKTNFTLISLPAKVLKGKIVFQSFDRNQPQKIINKKEEQAIYQTILKEGQKKISEIFAQEAGILPGEIQFIKTEILGTKIDGYDVPGLQGFDGRRLDFRILFTFLPKYYLTATQKLLRNFKNIKNITQTGKLKNVNLIHQAQGLLSYLSEIPNGIFLDIGGQLSQIFVLRDRKLEMISTIDIGGRTFSQILSKNFGLPEPRARVLKERYSKGKLSEEVRKRIKENFSQIIQTWFGDLKLKLKETKGLLPSTIFLFGGGSLLPEIEEILIEGDWSGLRLMTQPEVKILYPKDLIGRWVGWSPKDFKNTEDKTKKLNSPQDVPLLLLCHYAKKNF